MKALEVLKTTENCFFAFRCLQVLIFHYTYEFAAFIIPFSLFAFFTSAITTNYVCLVHFHTFPIHLIVLCTTVSTIGLLMLFYLFPVGATIYIKSCVFVCAWKNYVKMNSIGHTRKVNLAFLKSCYHVRCQVGPFLYFQKSTAYKLVLFLFLYTMKAVLLFGKQTK